ncbi:hypothetical protein ACFSKS_27355 [Pseudocitrobacter faecalis]
MAIWDANGKCILTNETRILTDLTQIGVPGGSANNGVNINYTMAGKYAIVPQAAGYRVAVSSSGTLQTPIGMCCYYNGTNTLISARMGEIPWFMDPFRRGLSYDHDGHKNGKLRLIK